MPLKIPSDLRTRYSMDKFVLIYENYWSANIDRAYCHYTFEMVENFISLAKSNNKNSFKSPTGWSYCRSKSANHYPETDDWLREALEKYPVDKKELVLIGSEEPYYEGIVIAAGATVTLVEYQSVTSNHPKLKTTTAASFEADNKLFDGAVSISSIEHSGLGRYGDLLDPDGDLKTMRTLFNKLKKDSLYYLAVPIGIDQILWNAHRVYGRHRFPLLVAGFEVVDSFGFLDSDFEIDEHARRITKSGPHRPGVSAGAHQPVFVLRKIS